MATRSPRATCSTPLLTLVDAKHANEQLDNRQEARLQIGFADQIFISETDLVDEASVEALQHRIRHMNPRAQQQKVHFGDVRLAKVFDLKGFNLNATLEIDPDFLTVQGHDHAHHDHDHGHEGHDQARTRPATAAHHAHDDDVKSFAFKSDRPFNRQAGRFPRRHRPGLRPKMLRYKGML